MKIRPLALAALLAPVAGCATPSVAVGLDTTAQPCIGVAVGSCPGHLGPGASAMLPSSTNAQCHVIDGRADRHCTPGALNLNVSQANIHGTICVPGWTATIRPPASYTTALKRRQKIIYDETGLADVQLEEDHLVSLSAGGNPISPLNLFPQPWPDAHRKDFDERQVQRDICSGRITLKQGQNQLLAKWSR
jgi:hypothetical protein